VQRKVSLQLKSAMHQLCVLNTTLHVGKPNWWCQSFYVKEHSLEAKAWPLKIKTCGGCHRLAHPLSQDTASPTHCSHINIKTELWVQWQLKSRSVCEVSWVRATGDREMAYVRGTAVLRIMYRVYCISCDRTFIPIQPQTDPTMRAFKDWVLREISGPSRQD